MRVLKMWEKDKIQIELTREEFDDFACAIDESERMSKEDPVKQRAIVYNMDRISFHNKLPFEGVAFEKLKKDCAKGLKLTMMGRHRKAVLKTNCKISGADCPYNIRYDTWGLHTLDDFAKWDEKVKNHCVTCENNIDMLKAITE